MPPFAYSVLANETRRGPVARARVSTRASIAVPSSYSLKVRHAGRDVARGTSTCCHRLFTSSRHSAYPFPETADSANCAVQARVADAPYDDLSALPDSVADETPPPHNDDVTELTPEAEPLPIRVSKSAAEIVVKKWIGAVREDDRVGYGPELTPRLHRTFYHQLQFNHGTAPVPVPPVSPTSASIITVHPTNVPEEGPHWRRGRTGRRLPVWHRVRDESRNFDAYTPPSTSDAAKHVQVLAGVVIPCFQKFFRVSSAAAPARQP